MQLLDVGENALQELLVPCALVRSLVLVLHVVSQDGEIPGQRIDLSMSCC